MTAEATRRVLAALLSASHSIVYLEESARKLSPGVFVSMNQLHDKRYRTSPVTTYQELTTPISTSVVQSSGNLFTKAIYSVLCS